MDIINDGVQKINSMKTRELERKLNLQKKQENKKSALAENEQLEFFEKTFNERQNCIEHMIQNSRALPQSELSEHFNLIAKEILILQKYVAASNLFINNYLLQRCSNNIQELNIKLKELESEMLPKKKFGFKNRSKTKIPEKSNLDVVDFGKSTNQNGSLKMLDTPVIECGFYKRINEVLCLEGDDIFKKDVVMENLTNCKIYLRGVPSTLHLNHLKNCQVFSGPVSTSIFAENCSLNCTLVIACQQLRLHASTNVNIYLHVTSRAIMEDCTAIGIAPYNWNYHNIEKDFASAGLDKNVNNWTCIDDFNWLNINKRSPHWREIEEVDRIKEWT